jgi:hypothetical protein
MSSPSHNRMVCGARKCPINLAGSVKPDVEKRQPINWAGLRASWLRNLAIGATAIGSFQSLDSAKKTRFSPTTRTIPSICSASRSPKSSTPKGYSTTAPSNSNARKIKNSNARPGSHPGVERSKMWFQRAKSSSWLVKPWIRSIFWETVAIPLKTADTPPTRAGHLHGQSRFPCSHRRATRGRICCRYCPRSRRL